MSNNTMRSQLNKLRPSLNSKSTMTLPKTSPMNWVKDGEDHINIWNRGSTNLGKFLSHGTKTPFIHNHFGKFCSMETFWKYIQSEERDDRIRVMSGVTLRSFARQLNMLRIKNFKAIILDTEWQKVQQYPDKMMMMMESSLPFDMYYINKSSNVRIRPTYFSWLVAGIDEIRSALKEDREPDFTFLKDRKNDSIYKYVLSNSDDDAMSDEEMLTRLETGLAKSLK